MPPTVKIAEWTIGQGHPCFIIAEAGVNHNGDMELARRLIDAAKASGADAVKFQTWVTEKLVTPDAAMAEYQKQNTGREESQFDMLKRLELSYSVFRELQVYATQQGILFLSTPDEEDSSDFLESLNVPAFKIGSGELTNLAYLKHVARKNGPMIISTGMGTLGDVETALRAVREAGNAQVILLHCTSNYPLDPAEANLRAIRTLATAFDVPVGFSDHTMGIDITMAAVALGACVIEKHFTIDRSLPGPDQQASLTPGELKAMVSGIRQVEAAMGDGIKRVMPSEVETAQVAHKSIVTARDIAAGTRLTEDMLTMKRPGSGLPPMFLLYVIGRMAKHDLPGGTLVTLDVLE